MNVQKTTTDIQNDLLEFAIKEKLGITYMKSRIDPTARIEEIEVFFNREV